MLNEVIKIENVGVINRANVNLNKITVILGENGTGKTLLLDIINFAKRYHKKALEQSEIDPITVPLSSAFDHLISDKSLIIYEVDGKTALEINGNSVTYYPEMMELLKNSKEEYMTLDLPEDGLSATNEVKNLYKLVEMLNKTPHKIVMSTHSPYIAMALNNCLIAGDAIYSRNVAPEKNEVLLEFYEKGRVLSVKDVEAILLCEGKSCNAMDAEGLINIGFIDEVGDKLMDEFHEMLEAE